MLNAVSTTFTDTQTPTGTYTVTNSVIDVVFQDTTGVLLLDDIAQFGGTIAIYHVRDAFVITGGTLSDLNVSNSDTLTFSDSGSHPGGVDQIIFGSGISAAGFNIVNGNTVQVACFAAATRIETSAASSRSSIWPSAMKFAPCWEVPGKSFGPDRKRSIAPAMFTRNP